jgi:hypothetical protein
MLATQGDAIDAALGRADRVSVKIDTVAPLGGGRCGVEPWMGPSQADIQGLTRITVPSRRGSAAPRCSPVARSMTTACTEPIVS